MAIRESANPENNDQDSPPITPIPFRGSLTVADALAAGSLGTPLGNKIAMWVIRLFLVTAFVYSSWFTIFAYQQENPILTRVSLALVVFVLFLICSVIGREIWYRRRANQFAKEGKFQFAPTEGEIDDDSIRTRAEVGNSTIHWSAFCGHRDSDRVVLLYTLFPASYVIIARSKFGSDLDWMRFLKLVRQKLERL